MGPRGGPYSIQMGIYSCTYVAALAQCAVFVDARMEYNRERVHQWLVTMVTYGDSAAHKWLTEVDHMLDPNNIPDPAPGKNKAKAGGKLELFYKAYFEDDTHALNSMHHLQDERLSRVENNLARAIDAASKSHSLSELFGQL